MYVSGRGFVNCNIHKSIRIDKFTFDVINLYHGRSFSDKLRNYVFDAENKKKKAR